MSDLSARLDLPLIKPSQAQKHVTHNEALQILDGLVQAVLEETGAETPPFEPVVGQLFALGPSPTGDWAGQADMLALRIEEAWLFLNPQDGWRAWDKVTGELVVLDAGAWVPVQSELENLDGVGIGTTSDATNRLAVASDASLFSHAGAGHQMKVNKAAVGDTASLLFQSNWTGHAEMGLAGDTAFSIKVSDDGSTWFDAFSANPTTQEVTMDFALAGDAVQQSAEDNTAGRLLTSGAFGWGGSAPRMDDASITDMDDLTQAGVWTVAGTVANKPDGTSGVAGVCLVTTRAFNAGPRVTQLLSYSSSEPELWARVGTGSPITWSSWRPVTPERGSNANGEYARFADGTQICWGEVSYSSVNCTISYAGGYRSGSLGVSATFAAAFSASPNISFTCSDVSSSDVLPLAIGNKSSTAWQPRFWRAASGTGDFDGEYYAIGRWF